MITNVKAELWQPILDIAGSVCGAKSSKSKFEISSKYDIDNESDIKIGYI